MHTPALIQSIEDACKRGPEIIDPAPTFVTRTLVRRRTARSRRNPGVPAMPFCAATFATASRIVRPPGHHAEPDRSMGFCIFNNIAIAARRAASRRLSRIAIVDYDAHHGNGTQAAFLDDDRVGVSVHPQWGIYPGTGWYEEAPHALGRIVNVPLPAGAGDQAY